MAIKKLPGKEAARRFMTSVADKPTKKEPLKALTSPLVKS